MLRDKKALMLISLLIAIGLWVYVIGSVDPVSTERIGGIKVEMEGAASLEEQDLHPTLNSPRIINVSIEGKRSQLNKVKERGIEAYVDVSSCEYGRNESRIHVVLPVGVTGVSVENMSNDTAVFTVK